MTNAFSSMEYPHWLMLAGAFLLMLGLLGLGFVALALRQRSVGAGIADTAGDQEPSKPKVEPAQTPVADRKAMLEEQKRDRWADRGTTTIEQ